MKKMLAMLLALVMILGLAACASTKPAADATATSEPSNAGHGKEETHIHAEILEVNLHHNELPSAVLSGFLCLLIYRFKCAKSTVNAPKNCVVFKFGLCIPPGVFREVDIIFILQAPCGKPSYPCG